jgi:hypothetical protein
MTQSSSRSTLGALALGFIVSACGMGQLARSAAPPAQTAFATSSTTVAPASLAPTESTAAPSPTPSARASAIASLVHCAGSPSGVLGASVHRESTWAGYVAARPPATFSCVEGSWAEPIVDCGAHDAAVQVWVGIGGYTSRDLGITDDNHALEKAGTGVDCVGGAATHYAWHQVEPREPSDIEFAATLDHPGDMVIQGGDRIWAQARYVGEWLRLTVADLSTGEVRSIVSLDPGRQRSSANWVVEGEDGLAVPRFGSVIFRNDMATMDGTLGEVGSTAWLRNEVDEWSDGVMRLNVSPLLAGGATFEVTWVHG